MKNIAYIVCMTYFLFAAFPIWVIINLYNMFNLKKYYKWITE